METLAGELRGALAGLDRPWIFDAMDLPQPDGVVDALAAELPGATVEPGPDAPVVRFAEGSVLTDHLSRNTRAAVAKARNRIARHGHELGLEWLREPDRVRAALPAVLEVHRGRNRQLRGTAILDDPREAALYRDSVLAHAERGTADLLTVQIDGDLAAFAVGLRGGGLLYVYSNYVAPEWLTYSAGTIANAEVVRYAFEQPGLSGVDWGPGVQRYKLSRAGMRSTQHVQAWSSTPLRKAVELRRRLRDGRPTAA